MADPSESQQSVIFDALFRNAVGDLVRRILEAKGWSYAELERRMQWPRQWYDGMSLEEFHRAPDRRNDAWAYLCILALNAAEQDLAPVPFDLLERKSRWDEPSSVAAQSPDGEELRWALDPKIARWVKDTNVIVLDFMTRIKSVDLKNRAEIYGLREDLNVFHGTLTTASELLGPVVARP